MGNLADIIRIGFGSLWVCEPATSQVLLAREAVYMPNTTGYILRFSMGPKYLCSGSRISFFIEIYYYSDFWKYAPIAVSRALGDIETPEMAKASGLQGVAHLWQPEQDPSIPKPCPGVPKP